MGVYHLMGLGRSPGTVTGPLTYLAHRYERWNADDQRFFARSGEGRQRTAGQKIGDVQALVLFSTREVLNGEVPTLDYVDNSFGHISRGLTSEEVLRDEYLAPRWKQGLIAEADGGYIVGPQWELVRPYQESLEEARQSGLSLEVLAQKEPWLEQEDLSLG